MALKNYVITDEGDAFQVQLFDGEKQVGGAFLPMGIGDDSAFELAMMLGDAFGQCASGGYPHAPVTAFNKGQAS